MDSGSVGRGRRGWPSGVGVVGPGVDVDGLSSGDWLRGDDDRWGVGVFGFDCGDIVGELSVGGGIGRVGGGRFELLDDLGVGGEVLAGCCGGDDIGRVGLRSHWCRVLLARSGGDCAEDLRGIPFLHLYSSRNSMAFSKCPSGSHEFSAGGMSFHLTR